MNSRFQTHYDLLGVRANASLAEIERAYQRHMSRFQGEDVPPDARLELKLKEARDTLADDGRREAYDRSLLAPTVVARRAGIDRRTAILGSAILAIAAGGAWVWMQPSEKPAFKPKTLEQLQQEATGSVGLLKGIDLSGQDRSIAVAFTSREGSMTTVCRDVAPGVQLVVDLSPRKVPAHVLSVDEARGFCTLAVDGGGGFPLALSQAEPKMGDVVYVPGFDAAGAMKIGQSKVKAISGLGESKEFTLEAPLPAGHSGLPLFDTAGRVVAVADAQGKLRPIPSEWMDIPVKAAPTIAAPEAAPGPRPAGELRPAPSSVIPTSPQDMTPERKKALEEAFRPPPKVPDDL